MKARVDTNRSPGQFVLAGSTRFLTTRRLSDTLTGRVGIVELLPLSAGEIRGRTETFIDRVFEGIVPTEDIEPLHRHDYAQAIATGGFPEPALGPGTTRLRTAWCAAYVATVTAATNVEQIADIRRPEHLGNLLRQAAARSAGEVVTADLAREMAIDETTVRSYLGRSQRIAFPSLVRGSPSSNETSSRTRR